MKLGLPLVAAKNPSWLNIWFHKKRYHNFMLKVLHSCPSYTLLCGLLYCLLVFIHVFALFFHFNFPFVPSFLVLSWPSSHVLRGTVPDYELIVLYIYTLFWIMLSPSESLVQCMVLCCHTFYTTFVCIDYLWLFFELSVVFHIFWLFPRWGKGLATLHIFDYCH